MIYIRLFQPQKTRAIALALVGASVSTLVPLVDLQARAQSPSPANSTAPRSDLTRPSVQLALKSSQQDQTDNRGRPEQRVGGATYVQPPDLPDRSLPGRREGDRIRGGCQQPEQPTEPVQPQDRVDKLIALMPLIQATASQGGTPSAARSSLQSVWGLTVAEHPSFLFYIPYSLTPPDAVEFVLQDENENYVYQTKFTPSGTSPGVVSFNLPSTAQPLEIGKAYHWYFVIYCGSDPDPDTFVEGWVQRTALSSSLKSQLAQATPQQSAAIYAQSGVWLDAVLGLAELRRKNPADAALLADWNQLLQSVGLEAIAQKPITSVLTPKD